MSPGEWKGDQGIIFFVPSRFKKILSVYDFVAASFTSDGDLRFSIGCFLHINVGINC